MLVFNYRLPIYRSLSQKIERDAHERWLQLNPDQRDVILAAAKEKVSKLKRNELQLLLNAAYQVCVT